MALGRALARGIQAAVNPLDDRWYQPIGGGASAAGVLVNAETALSHSAVWASVRLLAESVADMPLKIYQRRADGGKDEAIAHPLYYLLHDQPCQNPGLTSFSFRRVLMVHALLWGNGYAEILPGPRGPVDQLRPIHPDRIPNPPQVLDDGTLVYRVRQRNGQTKTLLEDQIFHLPGLSLDGVSGLSVMKYAREAIGLGVVARQYQSRFFGQGGRLGGILKVKGRLSKEGKQRLREDWQAGHSGQANAYRVAVMDDDVAWEQVGMSPEDAQVLASLDWSTVDCARFFNVPLPLINETSKITTWGTGIAELIQGFLTFTLMPWLTNWTQTISKDLILANRVYFAGFTTAALLKGDTLKRYQAYSLAAGGQAPWMSRQEIRLLEDLNPIDGLDDMLHPANMTNNAAEPMPPDNAPPAGARSPLSELQLLRPFVHDAAARIVRKEVARLSYLEKRHGADASAFLAAVAAFYAEHATYVAEVLRLDGPTAQRYVQEQQDDLVARGTVAIDDWEGQRVQDLVALAIGPEQRSEP